MEAELWFVEGHSKIQWKAVTKIQVYVYVSSKFFVFQSFWNVCCGNSWRCGWFVTSVRLNALFVCLNFQRTVWVCFFLVLWLERAWNFISMILLLWCPLSSLSCNFSTVQLRAVTIVLFLIREVLFSAVVGWMLARIVFWATVCVCWTWTSMKMKLLLTHTAVCTSPFQNLSCSSTKYMHATCISENLSQSV